jgi:hypothetical protein
MPSRPVLIGRGLVLQTLNQNHKTHHTSVQSARVHRSTTTNQHPPHTVGQGEQKRYGGHSDRETPGPIPNPEVKPASADGTATERLWESRTPPDIHCVEATQPWVASTSFRTGVSTQIQPKE